ncbi:hypothetical protein J5N97_028223 [Dioscorea zingiberensis]|uniref:Uncharacterized protein n=1 Tax=Dioscorea zingiberensis TaxID=325984 RepID=A0A9D5BYS6_9LILI|nr:hypothetical protein J5N97_028223 [Dioscorea zingiberensis]
MAQPPARSKDATDASPGRSAKKACPARRSTDRQPHKCSRPIQRTHRLPSHRACKASPHRYRDAEGFPGEVYAPRRAPLVHHLEPSEFQRSLSAIGMLQLEPFIEDRGQSAVNPSGGSRLLASLLLLGFRARRLACMLDSFVRVSRWTGWGACGPVSGARRWILVDRGSKATLRLTMTRRVFKLSAKDSTRRPFGIALQGGRPRLIHHKGSGL